MRESIEKILNSTSANLYNLPFLFITIRLWPFPSNIAVVCGNNLVWERRWNVGLDKQKSWPKFGCCLLRGESVGSISRENFFAFFEHIRNSHLIDIFYLRDSCCHEEVEGLWLQIWGDTSLLQIIVPDTILQFWIHYIWAFLKLPLDLRNSFFTSKYLVVWNTSKMYLTSKLAKISQYYRRKFKRDCSRRFAQDVLLNYSILG